VHGSSLSSINYEGINDDCKKDLKGKLKEKYESFETYLRWFNTAIPAFKRNDKM